MAYDVLGWGGYWGWDPVENASLVPWLTERLISIRLVHNGEACHMELSLICATFALTICEHLLPVQESSSVHAFSAGNFGGV